MIPRRTNALRISQEPFLFEGELPLPAVDTSPLKQLPELTEVDSPTVPTEDDSTDMDPPKEQRRNHHPQVIDQDVEDFTIKLDTMIGSFRNESIKEFLTMKRSILHE
jgi:hypothetical protein